MTLDNISSWDEATIIWALVLAAETRPEQADHCIAALRAMGQDGSAQTVEATLLREQSHSVKA